MNDQAREILARRAIEDRAIALGDQRGELEDRLAENTTAILDLLRDWEGSGIPLDRLASLVGVSRQTLHHWRERAKG
jgi:hypothetical protein